MTNSHTTNMYTDMHMAQQTGGGKKGEQMEGKHIPCDVITLNLELQRPDIVSVVCIFTHGIGELLLWGGYK